MDNKLKKVFDGLLSVYYRIPFVLGKLFKLESKGEVCLSMLNMCRVAEKDCEYYVSYRLRNKKTDDIAVLPSEKYMLDCAIVMQGPISVQNNFTLETVKLYKRQNPGMIIIVSTWNDEDEKEIERLRNAGVVIVTSQKPQQSGRLNINFQLVNTQAGIKKASELGVKYICKTRTDQRLYRCGVFEYMCSILETFPCGKGALKQEKRIIVLGMEYGNMFYPYLVSDFLYFGTAMDMRTLFDIPYDIREKGSWISGKSRKYIAENELAPEIYIMRNYIKKQGVNPECTVYAYWEFVKNYLVCIDKDILGLYWPKYDARYMEHVRNGTCALSEKENQYMLYNFDFINWMNLYTSKLSYEQKYESFADYIV